MTEDVYEAYLTGSSINGTFGKYEKEYNGHNGSDIDVVIIMQNENIPSNWKDLKTERSWWKLYSGGNININGVRHRIDILLVNRENEKKAKERMKELNWKIEKLK